MDGLSGREEDHEMKELTDDIAAATRKEAKFGSGATMRLGHS